MNEYPTEEELNQIKNWDYKDLNGLVEFVKSIWKWPESIVHREPTTDEFRHKYRELRLATGGWSGNESIIAALDGNFMFSAICWQSSHRGGLHIYHIKDLGDTKN